MSKLNAFLDAVGGKQKKEGNGWKCKCPAHNDSTASLSVSEGDDGTVLFKCFAGCDKPDILRAIGFEWKDVLPGDSGGLNQKKTIVAKYNYTDAAGQFLYQVVRWRPKNFNQRRLPKGKSPENLADDAESWIWDLKGVDPVIYRLPAIQAAIAKQSEIWVAAGEKDVEALVGIGLDATCPSGGEGHWRALLVYLRGAQSVVIVRDKDNAGSKSALMLFRMLSKIVPHVVVVEAAGGKDSHDHISLGYGVEDFLEVDPEEIITWNNKLPIIETKDRELRDISSEAYRAIVRGNTPYRIFSMGGNMLAKVTESAEGGFQILPLHGDMVRGVFARSANWIFSSRKPPKKPGGRWVISRHSVFPPKDLAGEVPHYAPFPDIPRLEGIAKCPVVDTLGVIYKESGYASGARLFLDIECAIDPVVGVSGADAAQWIFDEVLCDFPFADSSSRAHALALMLTPILRPMIEGPVPMFLIDAPVQGSGKSLLARCALMPGLKDIAAINAPKAEEEWEKMIIAQLMSGAQAVFLDNVAKRLDSPALCTTLVELRKSGRILGTSTAINLPVNLIWVATSNNARLSTDITRRTIYIRLDPGQERPELREEFRHENLVRWVRENRSVILNKLLEIVSGWIIDGKPKGSARFGSFESFAEILSGILETAGVSGFLANRDVLRESSDDDSMLGKSFVRWWMETLGTEPQTARQLRNMVVEQNYDLAVELFGDGTAEQQTRRVGTWLKMNKDRVVDMGSGCGEARVLKSTVRDGNNRFKLEFLSGHSGHSGHSSELYARGKIAQTDLFDVPMDAEGKIESEVHHVHLPGSKNSVDIETSMSTSPAIVTDAEGWEDA